MTNKPDHVTVTQLPGASHYALSCKRCGAHYIAGEANVREVEEQFFRAHSVCEPADASPHRIKAEPSDGAAQ